MDEPFSMDMLGGSPRMRTVRLYGPLGARFGREWRLAVATPAEAIRALCTVVPGFRAYLRAAEGRGMVFAVFRGRENINRDQLCEPPGSGDIRIAPVMQGAKRGGVLQTIVGIVLVVVGYWISGLSYGAAAPIGGAIANLGWAMVVGGVAQMLVGVTNGTSSRDSVANTPNYNFNGVVNTQAQGNPAPLGYGQMLVGSAVISGGIYAQDQG